jgi:hypothetical protein
MCDWGARPRAIAAILALLLPAALLSGCRGEETETPRPPLPHSDTGYELYSWFGGPDWRFALVIGTDRVRTFDEISERDECIYGTNALVDELSRLPEGELVLWTTQRVPGTTLPPVKTVDKVSLFCSHNGIRLEIAD